ncbi:MAG: hypothetical protein IJ093_04625 [Bacilli bacterium]|nr:hypothetical protein [Bacilli bacterium]
MFCVFISVSLFASFGLYLNYGLSGIKNYKSNYNYQLITDSDGSILKNFHKGYSYRVCQFDKKLSKKNFLKYYDKKILVVSGKDNYVINKIKDKGVYKKVLKNDIFIDGKRVRTNSYVPIGIDSYLEDYIVFVTDLFDNYCKDYITSYFIVDDIPSFEDRLSTFASLNKIKVSYVNVKKARILTNNFILAIKIVLYSLTFLMALIGVTTLINMCEASLSFRMGEMATLNSGVITNRQVNKMIRKEVYYIVRKDFVLCVMFVLSIDYLLYYSIKDLLEISFIIRYKKCDFVLLLAI